MYTEEKDSLLKHTNTNLKREEFTTKNSNPNSQTLPSNELTNEFENLLEQNLVWIFGAGRSGTTWLAKELLSYNTHVIDEPYLGNHLQTPGGVKKIHEFHKKRNDYFFSNAYKKIWFYYLRKLILNRFYSQIQDYSKHVIIKEPHGTMGSGNIIECLPKCKIIVVLRDGRDVLDSEIAANSPGGWSTKDTGISLSSKIDFIKRYANHWNILIETLFNTYESHPKELKYLVRYEDLRKNTVEELEKIYTFLKIDISNDQIVKIVNKFSFENIPSAKKGLGKSRRSATPGKWKENFNEKEKELMNSIMGKTLEKMGYKI